MILVDDVLLVVDTFGGWEELVAGVESFKGVLRRVGRIEFDQQRRRRRPQFGVMGHAAQVRDYRRVDITAVIHFDPIIARQTTRKTCQSQNMFLKTKHFPGSFFEGMAYVTARDIYRRLHTLLPKRNE